MITLPHLDMPEITLLTRAGRLEEAVATIQKGLGSLRSPTRSSGLSVKALQSPGLLEDDAAPGRAPFEIRTRPKKTRIPPKDRRSPPQPKTHLPDGAVFERKTLRNAFGEIGYKVYVPRNVERHHPALVVMLHGCTQDPDDFARGTRMNELADEHGFIVVYPEQTIASNPSRCWNWFQPNHQRRDAGEPALIADLTRATIAEFKADPRRVFVAGLSAGGAAAAIMGCAYPDLYAGVGIHSGLACGAASDMSSAFAAMKGRSHTNGPPIRSEVPTIVFHGLSDPTVSPRNASELTRQARTDGTSVHFDVGVSDDGIKYERRVWRTSDGKILHETWLIGGFGHAWSGGSRQGSYSDPRGPDASRHMLRFFGIVPS